MTESTKRKQNPARFKPGQSGNPKGRPKGARHRSTMAALALLEGESEALTRKAVEMALNGDMAAIRLCLERLVPARKEMPVMVNLPKLEKAEDIITFTARLIALVGSGDLCPGEAAALSGLADRFAKALELTDLEARLRKLEEER